MVEFPAVTTKYSFSNPIARRGVIAPSIRNRRRHSLPNKHQPTLHTGRQLRDSDSRHYLKSIKRRPLNQRNETHRSRYDPPPSHSFPPTNIQTHGDTHVKYHHPDSILQQRYGQYPPQRTQQSSSENSSRRTLPTPSRLFETSEYQSENLSTFQNSNYYEERPRHRTEIFDTPKRYSIEDDRQIPSPSSYQVDNQEYYQSSTRKVGQERLVPTYEGNYPTADSELHRSENDFYMPPNFDDTLLEDYSFLPQGSHNNRDGLYNNLDRFSGGNVEDVYDLQDNPEQQQRQQYEQNDPFNSSQLPADSTDFMQGETPDEDLLMPNTNQVSAVGVRSESRPESHNRKRSWDKYYSDGYRPVRNENIDPIHNWEVPPNDSFDFPLFDSSPDIEQSQPSGSLRFFNNGVEVDSIGNPLYNSRDYMAHTNQNARYDYRPARKRWKSSPENDSFRNFVS